MRRASFSWILGLFLAFGSSSRLCGQNLGGWEAPAGGWDYVYEARDGEEIDGEFDPSLGGGSLDGTWTHNNNSDTWDGSGPGDDLRPDGVTPAAPGGAGIVVVPNAGEGGGPAEVLSVVDTGDPRQRGFADPSNRKIWFCHDVSPDGVAGEGSLGTGLTLIVRSRLHPDIDPNTPGWQLPDGGIDNDAGQGVAPGYTLRDGGKGGHGFFDSGLARNFSFTPHGTKGYQLPPQVGEGLPPANYLTVGDNTVFHAFWVTILAGAQPDRFDVTFYIDGSTEPSAEFQNVELGNASDCSGISHLHLGFHSTPQVGGFQVDYFGYKIGLFQPSSACPGGFQGTFSSETGEVALSWSPVPTADSYTIRRNGVALREGLAASASSFTDPSPTRPAATYELVPIVAGAPKAGCTLFSVALRTVVCPELSCVPDPAQGQVHLTWTAPKFFAANGYTVVRDGVNVGTAPGDALGFSGPAPLGEHVYELAVDSATPGACPENPFCRTRLYAVGAIDVSGDNWDKVAAGGLARVVTASDGVKSLYFPAVAKGPGDAAFFAVDVKSLGAGEVAGGRFRVELQARYDNGVRITNHSTSPVSYLHFDLSRTGLSEAADETGAMEGVEQVPDPGDDPSLPSGSSTLVSTKTVGIALLPGINILEVGAVDGGGVPHGGNVQLFSIRIGFFASDLDAALTVFPCASGLHCSKEDDGSIQLSWTTPAPHAYEIERDGALVGTIPKGSATTFTDPDPGPGFFKYRLITTDDDICPPLEVLCGGGGPDPDGFLREWLVLGPLDWGCAASCDNPGVGLIRVDYLEGTSAGKPVSELTIEPVDGTEILLGAQATVRATARSDINPGKPQTGKWFPYVSPQSLVDCNIVFGGDPGNNFMVYAATYIDNKTGSDLSVDMGVTSDDSVQVLIDDQEVHINSVARGVGLPGSAAFDVVPGITLPTGVSRILVKVFEGGGGTGFALRFEEPGTGVPITRGLTISLKPGSIGPVFHRGDSDDNGQLQLTDAVRILGFLFLGGQAPTCFDAADADDNGQLQLTDAVRILGFLFLGGAPPAPPGPPPAPCGPDPSAVHLGCAQYGRC